MFEEESLLSVVYDPPKIYCNITKLQPNSLKTSGGSLGSFSIKGSEVLSSLLLLE